MKKNSRAYRYVAGVREWRGKREWVFEDPAGELWLYSLKDGDPTEDFKQIYVLGNTYCMEYE